MATDDNITTVSGTAVTENIITSNDTDANGDTLSVTEFSVAGDTTVYTPGDTATITGVGTITITAAGLLTFTPESGYAGAVPDVNYTITDGTSTDSATVSFTEVPEKLAYDDTDSMQEDSGTISGNVLDNDKTGLTVTTIQIAGTDYSVGTAIDITDVGTVQIDADGAYSFTPVQDYSGDVPDITYTVDDGTTTDTADLSIEVIAVADEPTTGNFVLDPVASTLNILTWSNAREVDGQNLLANGGSGADSDVLIAAIDYLRDNIGTTVTNSNGSTVNETGSGTTTSLTDTSLATRDAVYISGYVFLEVGETYTYSGSADDSATIVIGDNVSSLHVSWQGTDTSGNEEFQVTQSGYYSFQFYAHNANGVGNYDFTVENADGTDMKYYPTLAAIEDSLLNTSYVLGDYDAGVDGNDDTGFYSVNRGYEGLSSDVIVLTDINLTANDTDGSEYLSFEISGLPAGAVVSFVDADNITHSITAAADGIATYVPTDENAGTTEYTDFTLNVGDQTDALLDVTLTVTSTEKSNGDSSSSTLDFEVQVTDGGDNDIIVFDANDTLIDGGDGTDTLLINVDGTSIDFSSFDSSVFESIEVIDMTDNGAQSLTNLTTSDVLNIINDSVMTDKGLIIKGDAADSVSLSGSDWISVGTSSQGGNSYNVYSFDDTNGTHELLIQTDITIL